MSILSADHTVKNKRRMVSGTCQCHVTKGEEGAREREGRYIWSSMCEEDEEEARAKRERDRVCACVCKRENIDKGSKVQGSSHEHAQVWDAVEGRDKEKGE